MKYSKFSAVIIGSGIAGLYAALKIEQQLQLPNGVLLITKSKLGESNSYYAQGGMVAVLKENEKDSVESHVTDTIKAGAGLSELNTIRFISENSDKVVKDLLKFGVEFDRDENGKFTLTKEAAHSVRRILHSGGDATGREMEIALCQAVKENKNITLYENTVAVDLLIDENTCGGVVLLNADDEYETIYSNTVIMATGGLGQLYQYTTNPKGATGDGFALSYRAGALLQDMEFVQFHPTALAFDGAENRFLISEAVRGEGAKLCDEFGMEFMFKYHEKKELAPRDIVARSIFCEMNNNGDPCVFLNATGLGEEKLLQRFPTIAKKCKEYDIDIAQDFIPVAPAAHYFMGGVKTNIRGESSVNGLYAIGEVSSTGLHGANRLASNSLLEALVFSRLIAEDINTRLTTDERSEVEYDMASPEGAELPTGIKTEVRHIMQKAYFIHPDYEEAEKGLVRITELKQQLETGGYAITSAYVETKSLVTVAYIILTEILERKDDSK